ncbi:MAG: 16S rRNA (uracil(1498)-N(3))-methyltransferase [Bacteroidales bacterium]
MHLFYYPCIKGKVFTLDKSESTHCIKVLRLSANDIIYLTDGKGRFFKAKIKIPDKKACVTEILKITDQPPERNYSLQIAISPTKNIERFEWFLEKSTEIGTDRIIPLLCKNSERRVLKYERLKKVMISAMKQSLKAWLPGIAPFEDFDDLVIKQFHGSKFIATGNEPAENHLGKLYVKESDVLILIGPEGDFSEQEMNMALQNGFTPVSLSKSRLRTETAGIVACHAVNFINSPA